MLTQEAAARKDQTTAVHAELQHLNGRGDESEVARRLTTKNSVTKWLGVSPMLAGIPTHGSIAACGVEE